MRNEEIGIDVLKACLSYQPQSGHFTWICGGKGITTGSRAGTRGALGHRIIRIRGRFYHASRLAWFWTHGVMPRKLKFLNGDVDDCRIENLAEWIAVERKHDHHTKEGRAAYQKDYRSVRRRELSDAERKRRFGITAARYAAMLAEQNGLCAICGKVEGETRNGKVKALAVDHDHESGRIRGLLCVACNTGLGKLGDDRGTLLKAVEYLDRHAT